jgi:hypothetical protein
VVCGRDEIHSEDEEKLQARKMLENRAESHKSTAPQKIARDHFIREKRGIVSGIGSTTKRKYNPKRQARKPDKAMASIIYDSRAAPWFPVKLI